MKSNKKSSIEELEIIKRDFDQYFSFEYLLGEKEYKQLWKKADDVIETSRSLGEIYDNVPEELKEVPIKVLEIHIFPKKFKKKINYFLNDEKYPNSLDFIEED